MAAAIVEERRSSIRPDGRSFAEGLHFVTLVTAGREPLFGEVRDGAVRLTAYGEIVEREWLRAGFLRADVEPDAFVVVPDRFHAIVALRGGARGGPRALSLGAVIAGFKATCSVQINHERGTPGAAVWQRDWSARIVPDAAALARVRRHIAEGPATWRPPRWRP